MATRLLLGALLFVAASSAVVASELSDSMQLFFDGRIQQAEQNLNYLISNGSQDARVFYFRGLANHRLGKLDAASADFQRAAMLELQTGGVGVGQALQRVQGAERLLLEKHRTMARLRSRQRRQPIAPGPAVARALPTTTNVEQAVPSLFVSSTPRFRLASEVPLRNSNVRSGLTASSMVAKDEQSPAAPKLVPSAGDDDAPVGTGVVQASTTTELDEDDPFANAPGEFGEEDDIFSSEEPSSGSSSGLFGAFRAIGKALTPKVDPSQMVPRGIPLPGPGAPGGGGEEEFPFE